MIVPALALAPAARRGVPYSKGRGRGQSCRVTRRRFKRKRKTPSAEERKGESCPALARDHGSESLACLAAAMNCLSEAPRGRASEAESEGEASEEAVEEKAKAPGGRSGGGRATLGSRGGAFGEGDRPANACGAATGRRERLHAGKD